MKSRKVIDIQSKIEIQLENLYTQQLSLAHKWLDEQLKNILPEEMYQFGKSKIESEIEQARQYSRDQGLQIKHTEDGLDIEIWKADKILCSASFRIDPKNN